MLHMLRVVPVVLLLAAGGGIQTAQAQALDANVAGVLASLATACAVDGANLPVNRVACLAAVSAAIQLAATLPPGLQAQIGVLLGDLIELVPSLADAGMALLQAADLTALSSGVQVGLSTPGVTSPLIVSPA